MLLVDFGYHFRCPTCRKSRVFASFKTKNLDEECTSSCGECSATFTTMRKGDQLAIVKQQPGYKGYYKHLFRINTPHGYLFITKTMPDYNDGEDIHEREALTKFWIEENTSVCNLFDCSVELSTWWRKTGLFAGDDDVVMYVGAMPLELFEKGEVEADEILNDTGVILNEAGVILTYLSKRDGKDYVKLMRENKLYDCTELAMNVDDKYTEPYQGRD